MSYSVKKAKSTSAKFKSLSIDSAKNFIDLETGEILDLAGILASSFGENEPIDLSATVKSEEEVTPDV